MALMTLPIILVGYTCIILCIQISVNVMGMLSQFGSCSAPVSFVPCSITPGDAMNSSLHYACACGIIWIYAISTYMVSCFAKEDI